MICLRSSCGGEPNRSVIISSCKERGREGARGSVSKLHNM